MHFCAIPSTSKREKSCRMPEIIFCLFQCSRVIRWIVASLFCAIVFGSSWPGHTRKRHYVASRKCNEILNWHIDRYFFSGQQRKSCLGYSTSLKTIESLQWSRDSGSLWKAWHKLFWVTGYRLFLMRTIQYIKKNTFTSLSKDVPH